jgi:type IX secretion system substrate protein
MGKIRKGIILLLCLLPLMSVSQSMRDIKLLVNNKSGVIVDYGYETDVHSWVPFRGELISNSTAGRLAGNAVFEVTYIDFTPEQQDAFDFAVDIWSTLLHSEVPIRITAKMSPLGSGVLGQTSIPERYGNFDNAQKINTLYVVAMAEKIAGYELNGAESPDIEMELSSNFAFYFGTDGGTPSTQFDFVSIILHEIGHGLGFIDGTFQSANTGLGYYNVFNAPVVYGRHLETSDGSNVVATVETGTTELGDILVGDDLFFNSFSFPTLGDRPKLFAPSPWNSGSSIAHLDENTYPPGNPNSLMSPQFGFGESIHDPGFAYEMFQDMGWVAMDIDLVKFLDSEDSVTDRTVTATVLGDSAVISDSVMLHYTYSDFATEDSTVLLIATGNANEYSGIIPATGGEEKVSYYIDVDAVGGKTFTSPGEAPQFFWQFVMAKDTIPPEIEHVPLNTVFLPDAAVLPLGATVVDNTGVNDLILSYKINDGTINTMIVPLIKSTSDGFYEGEYFFNWDIGALGVVEGDSVEYKLEIQDIAAAGNITADPETGFHKIRIAQINPPALRYQNDFNSPTNDFAGSGFVIGPEVGFDSDAIQSDHPYRVVDGTSATDSVSHIYLLKTPIILSDKDASMIFDEVVLVEPGRGSTEYGDEDFWDYVIVEGSLNNGVDWFATADGYDSRQEQSWFDFYMSDLDSVGNSLVEGRKSLYISHEINLTANGNFVAGDTLLIRFRVYADPFAHGWGWAIDNLKIQIDEKAPVITQITPDYLLVGDTELILRSKVEDNIELDSVVYEVDYNGQVQFLDFPGTANLFTVNLNFPAITATDVIKYRIIAVDKAPNPNTIILPSVGFFEVPVAVMGAAKDMYVSDFNTGTDDFIGNNFSITQPTGFSDPALVSINNYPDAPFDNADMYHLLKFPITLNQSKAFVQYDEMVLVEPNIDEVAFEVSKDGGSTWITVFDPYSSAAQTSWSNLFIGKTDAEGNSLTEASPSFMKQRFFDILDNPNLTGGEEVLVRFRMSVNDSINGWGWIIDNFEIQGPTTAIEDEWENSIQIYPNPTNSGRVVIKGKLSGNKSKIVVADVLGKIVLQKEAPIVGNTFQTTLNLTSLKNGIYIISVSDNTGIHTSRLVVE